MGCDIHSFAEKKVGERFVAIPKLEPFNERMYGTFAFLAGVRNYSGIPALAEARGFPTDASDTTRLAHEGWGVDAHTPSWLSLQELTEFNYDSEMEDRRFTKQVGPNAFDGGATCDPGQGKRTTWREFLGSGFFNHLDELKEHGAERIVFWFDN